MVIPLYNKRSAVETMMKSVLSQEFGSYEVVIVNDGSTDGSEAAIKPLLDERCRLIEQSNKGVSVARNRGITEARGKYIALMDADDYWYPDHLATATKFFEKHPEIKWFCSSWLRVDSLDEIEKRESAQKSFEVHYYFDSGHAEASHPVWTSALSFERAAFSEIEIFPPGMKRGQDLYAWYKMALEEPSFGWSPYRTALYNFIPPPAGTPPKRPCYFIERIMSDLWHLGPARNNCATLHIEKALRFYLELGDVKGLRNFLRSYKAAMSWGFRIAWWVLSLILAMCGKRFTSGLLQWGLRLRRVIK